MKFRSCFVCGGDIEVYLNLIGNRKRQKRVLISDEGVFINQRWVCNHCFKLNFEEFFKKLSLLSKHENYLKIDDY